MARLRQWLDRKWQWPLRGFWRRLRWLRYAIPLLLLLLLLGLFGPALQALVHLFDFCLRVLEPLLQTTLGRSLLLVLVVGGFGALFVKLLGSRVRELRGQAALGRLLLATAALVGDDRKRSREALYKLARYRGPLPAVYPHLVADACLKLARLALAERDADEALQWLLRIVEPGLPAPLHRSLLQLRLRALRLQAAALPQSLLQEVEAALAVYPTDAVLLRERRELELAAGDFVAAAATQARVYKNAAPAVAAAEQQRWQDDLQQAAAACLATGDVDAARQLQKKLQAADRGGSAAMLLLGDICRQVGDLRGALRAYGSVRSPLALDRLAELLQQEPELLDPRELLELCPLQGSLLLLARELARRGDRPRAERAARLAAEALGPTPTVCAVLAEVLQLLDHADAARQLREQALLRLLEPARDAE